MIRDTCPKEERMQISASLDNLAHKILTKEEIVSADDLTRLLVLGTKTKREIAISKLRLIANPPPYRPLYYLNHELQFLPNWTRSIVFHSSALIELLCKALLYDKIERKMPIKEALGTVISKLLKSNIISENLSQILQEYNNEFFAPAKHNWNVKNRRHLFTTREAVYCIFISFNLAKLLRTQNEYVEKVAKDEVEFDFIY